MLPLPIVASPEFYSIELPARRSVVALPIVAFPAVYQIDLPSGDQHAEEQEAVDLVAEDSDQFTVACPGCKNEYTVPRDAIGESAECECGFVFQIKDNVDAIDTALSFDLVPFPPIVKDRTGERANQPSPNAKESTPVELAETVRNRDQGSDSEEPSWLWVRYMASTLAVIPIAVLIFWGVLQPRAYRVAWEAALERFAAQESTEVIPTVAPVVPSSSANVVPAEEIELASAESREQTQRELSEFLLPVAKIAIELRDQPRLDRPALKRFSGVIESLRDRHQDLTERDLLWLGEQWSSLGERAMNADLASRCYYQASSAYSLLLTVDQTDVSKAFAEEQHQLLFERSREQQRIALIESGRQIR
ncbi:hypothetical protein C2E31_17040 [Rhodopirellula baltica]|nr:hypothetical protein C2E31_17040 [Rhodopirellula baltica]